MDDPYSILNVYPDCTYEEAKAAYRKAALIHHPDRHPLPRKAEAERRFRVLANAFQQVCHELGHPIEPPEIVPPAPPPDPAPSTKVAAVTERGPESSLSRFQPPRRSARGPDEFGHELHRPIGPPARGPRTATRDELIRNREMDELEDQSPYDDDDALDPRPSYPDARPPTNAYAQEYHRSPSNPYPLDHPHRRYRDGAAPSNARAFERFLPDEPRHEEHSAPRRSVSSQFSSGQRRASFSSHSAHDWPGRRDLVERDSRPYARGPQRVVSHTDRPAQHDLYDLKPPARRDGFGGGDEWDGAFGMAFDDFFSGGRSNPFVSGGNKLNDLGMGFDNLMSSAMNGLKLAGPGPDALENIGSNPSCMMRMRQSKTIMGQNVDGSWTGRKIDKQMRYGDGKMEINENGQDIRIGGGGSGSGASESAGGGRGLRNGNTRGHAEDWDPPPAYEGDDVEFEDPDRYLHHPDDYYSHPQRRVDGPPLDRHGSECADRDSSRMDRDPSRVDRDLQRADRDLSRMDRDLQRTGRDPPRMDPDLQRMDRDLQRMDRDLPSRSNDQIDLRSSARARPNPTRGYLEDGPAYGGYRGGSGGGSGAGPRGYLDDWRGGYEGGGGGLVRSQSSSQGRSHHPEGRSMVKRRDGPVVRR